MTNVWAETWGPQRPEGRGRVGANLGWLAMIGAIYALGTRIPLYGVNPEVGAAAMPGVGMSMRLSIFGLGLMPLFTPLAFLELAKLFIPRLARWQVASARNMYRLNDYVRLAAFVTAALQGYGIATAMMQVPGMVTDPGIGFVMATISSYVGSTALLTWLADRISLRGFGNGFWLLWIAPLLSIFPVGVMQLFDLLRIGAMVPGFLLIGAGLLLISGVAVVVANLVTVDQILVRNGQPPAPAVAWWARVATQALIWPPFLANIVIGLIVVPLHLLLPDGWIAPGWLSYGSLGHAFLSSVLILLFAYAYARKSPNWRRDISDVFGSEAGPKGLPAPFWAFGLIQVVVCASWELWASLSPAMAAVTGSNLIIVVIVAMAFTRPWRLRLS